MNTAVRERPPPIDGQRGAYIVFDLQDPSDIPVIAEPLFIEMGAKIELLPVMNADDVQSLSKVAGGERCLR